MSDFYAPPPPPGQRGYNGPGLDPMYQQALLQYLMGVGAYDPAMMGGGFYDSPALPSFNPEQVSSMYGIVPQVDAEGDPLSPSNQTNYLQDYVDLMMDPALMAFGGVDAFSPEAFQGSTSYETIDSPELMQMQQYLAADPTSFEGMVAAELANGGTPGTATAKLFEVLGPTPMESEDPAIQAIIAQFPLQDYQTGEIIGFDWNAATARAEEIGDVYARVPTAGPTGTIVDPATGQVVQQGGENQWMMDANGNPILVEASYTPSPLEEKFNELGLSSPFDEYQAEDFMSPEWQQLNANYVDLSPQVDQAYQEFLEAQSQSLAPQPQRGVDTTPGVVDASFFPTPDVLSGEGIIDVRPEAAQGTVEPLVDPAGADVMYTEAQGDVSPDELGSVYQLGPTEFQEWAITNADRLSPSIRSELTDFANSQLLMPGGQGADWQAVVNALGPDYVNTGQSDEAAALGFMGGTNLSPIPDGGSDPAMLRFRSDSSELEGVELPVRPGGGGAERFEDYGMYPDAINDLINNSRMVEGFRSPRRSDEPGPDEPTDQTLTDQWAAALGFPTSQSQAPPLNLGASSGSPFALDIPVTPSGGLAGPPAQPTYNPLPSQPQGPPLNLATSSGSPFAPDIPLTSSGALAGPPPQPAYNPLPQSTLTDQWSEALGFPTSPRSTPSAPVRPQRHPEGPMGGQMYEDMLASQLTRFQTGERPVGSNAPSTPPQSEGVFTGGRRNQERYDPLSSATTGRRRRLTGRAGREWAEFNKLNTEYRRNRDAVLTEEYGRAKMRAHLMRQAGVTPLQQELMARRMIPQAMGVPGSGQMPGY